jgi:hypothetical protein
VRAFAVEGPVTLRFGLCGVVQDCAGLCMEFGEALFDRA